MKATPWALWEIWIGALIVALGFWLLYPEGVWGVSAAVFALGATVLAARTSRPVKVAASVLGLAGSGAALHASWQVAAIENNWEEVRTSLVERATRQLEITLGDAVAIVEALAERGANLQASSRSEMFSMLQGGLAARSPERGVVVFGRTGEPWAWAGNLRIPPVPIGVPLRAQITPFYVVLEAERTRDGQKAVAQLLLAGDSAVPNRDATVAARFARLTGSELRFSAPGPERRGRDFFQYCVPDCNSIDVQPDTLFAVQPVPPTQGTLKLMMLERGGRRVAVALAMTLVVFFVVVGSRLRFWTLAGGAVLLLVTPLGPRLWLEPLFSPRTYFLSSFGLLNTSAGGLVVLAGVALVLIVALWGRSAPKWRGTLLPIAGAVVVISPFVLRALSRGVTVPEQGVGLGTWIIWTTSMSLVGTATLAVAALCVRVSGVGHFRWWAAWAAGGLAFAAGLLGLRLWDPLAGWPLWYLALWIPAMFFAVHPGRRSRVIAACAGVSGTAVILFIWGAVLDGRVLNAERDISRLADRVDPIALGALEEFGTALQSQPVPSNAAGLYARWQRSSLSRDDYPASLAIWNSEGERIAQLELAALSLPRIEVEISARNAVGRAEPLIEELAVVPGGHYLLTVPFGDGSVVSVVVGPRSRAIAPIRVARFLRGERLTLPPYEIFVANRMSATPAAPRLEWRKEGRVVMGERSIAFPEGFSDLQVRVPLGGMGDLLVRGALLVGLNAVLAALFVLLGETVQGRLKLDPQSLWRSMKGGSYRTRLTLVLALFFFMPTLGLGIWSVGRFRAQIRTTRDLVIRQTLQNAGGAELDFAVIGYRSQRRLDELANQLDADLLLYGDGKLLHSSARVLAELGLVEPYLFPDVFQQIVLGGGLEREATADRNIGGRRTRVAYRALTSLTGQSLVLAALSLVDEPRLSHDQQDIFFGLVLVILIGFAAASGLATIAGRELAQPVQALRDAAVVIGSGKQLPPFDPKMPDEFVPVVSAFEQMAADVTAHQAALRDALNFTGAVLRNVATGVVALGAGLRVTTTNPSAIQLLGVDPSPYEPVDRQTGSEWKELWNWVRVFLDGERETDAKEFTVGDKRIRAQVAVLETDERGCVLALDDASELAVAERVLAWGEMARQVAHEIKNPLTPIRLGVQHLQRAHRDKKGDFDEALQRISRQILAEIERLDAIARAFSRFGAPPVEAEPLKLVDVAEIARETASLYTMGSGTMVTVRTTGVALGMVRKDELKEVLINLVENARGAGASEVVIEAARQADGRITFGVRDNGSGISPEDLPRVFEPKFSTTTSGTGLGLAICKRLVESWGGTIRAESDVGVGTTVRFFLEGKQGAGGRERGGRTG